VGLEGNIYYKHGQLLESNIQVVGCIVRIARDMNREIATLAQARQIFRVSLKASKYSKERKEACMSSGGSLWRSFPVKKLNVGLIGLGKVGESHPFRNPDEVLRE
jgi:hypothetical protein